MTGNLYLDLLISFAGIAVLVGVSFALGGWKSARVDEVAAQDRLAFDEPDFDVVEWLFSEDGKAAAAISRDGEEIAYIFAVGDGLSTRRVRKGAAKVEAAGEMVTVRLGDASFGRLRLAARDGEAAARWAGRLGGAGYT